MLIILCSMTLKAVIIDHLKHPLLPELKRLASSLVLGTKQSLIMHKLALKSVQHSNKTMKEEVFFIISDKHSEHMKLLAAHIPKMHSRRHLLNTVPQNLRWAKKTSKR